MARQSLVHSHKTERKVLEAGRWAGGWGALFLEYYAVDSAFCVTTAFICFLADFTVTSKRMSEKDKEEMTKICR